jgi:hypothetical protein
MTVRPIRITGDPVLHTPTQDVVVWDSHLRQLVTDMVDTMRAAPGVGLAAPQIGVGLKVFVWEWSDDDVLHEGVIINPTLSKARIPRGKPDAEADLEGCLSVPDFRFERFLRVFDFDGVHDACFVIADKRFVFDVDYFVPREQRVEQVERYAEVPVFVAVGVDCDERGFVVAYDDYRVTYYPFVGTYPVNLVGRYERPVTYLRPSVYRTSVAESAFRLVDGLRYRVS